MRRANKLITEKSPYLLQHGTLIFCYFYLDFHNFTW